MFPLYKKDGSIVNFTTEEGRALTLEQFPNKYALTFDGKSELKVEPEIEEFIADDPIIEETPIEDIEIPDIQG